jgi:Astacin (Peptidase family M12A)
VEQSDDPRKDDVDPLREAGHCNIPPVVPREFDPGTDFARVAAILVFDDKWLNGTELRYHFMSNVQAWRGTDEDKDVVREAFSHWKDVGIGLSFIEVDDVSEAEIRIGFQRGAGSWSYLGRQILDRPMNERTMNFGWKLAGWDYGFDTALHEIGHTLGLPHEHQNPNAGIVWNEEAVYTYFGGPPNNWPRDKTFHNILRKLSPNLVRGSDWDPDSVMHYQFRAGLIQQPEKYQTQSLTPAGNLSEDDLEWIKTFYPPPEPELPELKSFRSVPLELEPGQQVDFAVRPVATRQYKFQTFGAADTVMALFEDVNGNLRFRDGDDDSGTANNAMFKLKLFKGREYVLRLRLYWEWESGETAVMMT